MHTTRSPLDLLFTILQWVPLVHARLQWTRLRIHGHLPHPPATNGG